MNIFILSNSAQEAAQMACDKHCIKMCLETAQLLCSVYSLQNIKAPYRLSHPSHPCSTWVRQSLENFQWLVDHGLALCAEYSARYGKVHKSQAVIEWCAANKNQLSFPQAGMTRFALAMPKEYQQECPVESYRSYYKGAKKHLHQWKRNKPNWI